MYPAGSRVVYNLPRRSWFFGVSFVAVIWSCTLCSGTVVQPIGATIALLGPHPFDQTNPLLKLARYIWQVPDKRDWGEYLDCVPHGEPRGWWRKTLCGLADAQFLGGVRNCQAPALNSRRRIAARGGGSAGILLYYRFELQERLRTLVRRGIEYDWIITSRADYLWLCTIFDGTPMSRLEPAIYIPTTQTWGGYSDRIHIMHRQFVAAALNVTQLLLSSAPCALEKLNRSLSPIEPCAACLVQPLPLNMFDLVSVQSKRSSLAALATAVSWLGPHERLSRQGEPSARTTI